MLVLTRKHSEQVIIGDASIVVTVLEIRGDKVRLGFEAPRAVEVHRREVWEQLNGFPPGDDSQSSGEIRDAD